MVLWLCVVVVCCGCVVVVLLFWTRALMCDVCVYNDMAMQQSLRQIELITCVMGSPCENC